MTKPTLFILGAVLSGVLLAACGGQSAGSNTSVSNTAPVSPTANNDMSNMGNHEMANMDDHDMSKMSNSDMANMPGHDSGDMKSSPGAAKQPYDLQFIDTMIVHHQGAVKMAQMVIGKTQRAELKSFAQKIENDQNREIGQLKKWRDQWYAGKPAAVNMDMPGMMNEGMKIMNGEHMKSMDEMEPAHFDNHFLNMMIPHHQGAIYMAKEALSKAEHQEIKDLATRIITAQAAEIKQMQGWKATWKEK